MQDEYLLSKDVYAHKNGLKYAVNWSYDNDSGSPLEVGECGPTEVMNWDPTDQEDLDWHIESYDVGLEEESRLRLLKVLRKPNRMQATGIYYDYLTALNKAHTEWGITDHDAAVRAVDADYEWLKGWYNDDWHWVTLSVAPIDSLTNTVTETLRQYRNGYESSILEDKNAEWARVSIEEVIAEIEWERRLESNPNQMELSFA